MLTQKEQLWTLYVARDAANDWAVIAEFRSLSGVARHIAQLEAISLPELSFQMQVPVSEITDSDPLSHFEFQGRCAIYVIERSVSE